MAWKQPYSFRYGVKMDKFEPRSLHSHVFDEIIRLKGIGSRYHSDPRIGSLRDRSLNPGPWTPLDHGAPGSDSDWIERLSVSMFRSQSSSQVDKMNPAFMIAEGHRDLTAVASELGVDVTDDPFTILRDLVFEHLSQTQQAVRNIAGGTVILFRKGHAAEVEPGAKEYAWLKSWTANEALSSRYQGETEFTCIVPVEHIASLRAEESEYLVSNFPYSGSTVLNLHHRSLLPVSEEPAATEVKPARRWSIFRRD